MSINGELLLLTLLPLLALSVLLSFMAGRRGLSRAAWAAIGFIPILNLLGLVILALKPKSMVREA